MHHMDLISPSPSSDTTQRSAAERADVARYLDPDPPLLANARDGHDRISNSRTTLLFLLLSLDFTSTEFLEVVSHIDFMMQYGEDEEPKEVCLSTGEILKLHSISAKSPVQVSRLSPIDELSCNMTIYGVCVDLLRILRMINRRGANKVASRILSPAERAVFGRASATRFLGVQCMLVVSAATQASQRPQLGNEGDRPQSVVFNVEGAHVHHVRFPDNVQANTRLPSEQR